MLTKELEVLKEVGVKATEALKVAEETNLELEKELTCKNWEIKDHAAVKDAQYCNIFLLRIKRCLFSVHFFLSLS